jgi:uncharacterized RmlC-like cupin family protein
MSDPPDAPGLACNNSHGRDCVVVVRTDPGGAVGDEWVLRNGTNCG